MAEDRHRVRQRGVLDVDVPGLGEVRDASRPRAAPGTSPLSSTDIDLPAGPHHRESSSSVSHPAIAARGEVDRPGDEPIVGVQLIPDPVRNGVGPDLDSRFAPTPVVVDLDACGLSQPLLDSRPDDERHAAQTMVPRHGPAGGHSDRLRREDRDRVAGLSTRTTRGRGSQSRRTTSSPSAWCTGASIAPPWPRASAQWPPTRPFAATDWWRWGSPNSRHLPEAHHGGRHQRDLAVARHRGRTTWIGDVDLTDDEEACVWAHRRG